LPAASASSRSTTSGIEPLDNERTGCALFGYWLGRAYWGRGIGTEAARMYSDMILQRGDVVHDGLLYGRLA
jgi:RimJ/RimL family protein N-acetyltransferase